jgi:hypothetical protein
VEPLVERPVPSQGFVPAPAPASMATAAPDAEQVGRTPNLFDKFKGLAFSRSGINAPLRPGRPMDTVEVRERATVAVEHDEIGDIPAFLRKEREHA